MKRCEVTRQLMDADFPRERQYTGIYRVRPPFGSTPVRGRMEELPADSRPPLRFSPSMRAGLRANDESLAHAGLGVCLSVCQQASNVR